MEADVAVRAFRAGHLLEAWSILEQRSPETPEDAALRTELLHLLGDVEGSRTRAAARARQTSVAVGHRSRYLMVLSYCYTDEGNTGAGLRAAQMARAAAHEASDSTLIALSSTLLLERSCDQSGFDASVPLVAETRRAVTRCADSQVHACAHAAFGRLEARAGRFHTALKHFEIGRQLLRVDPNQVTSAGLDLDESSVVFLMGDVPGAVELATRGSQAAESSGWARGQLIGALNLAQFFVSLGRLSEAEAQLTVARGQVYRSISSDFALADTQAQIYLVREQYAQAETILRNTEGRVEGVPRWYELSNQVTYNKLLLRQNRLGEAAESSARCVQVAHEAGAEQLCATLEVQRAEALVRQNGSINPIAAEALHKLDVGPLSVVGLRYLVTAKALDISGVGCRGRHQLQRAIRLLEQVGDKVSELDGRLAASKFSKEDWSFEGKEFTHLDAAAALLELAGHPHILARETFAVLQETRCAEALALVAAGPAGPRLVAVHGWTEAEAADAVRRAAPDDLMAAGQHRGETWQILARPGPDLDQHCTLAAVRKLVATARTLDHYRREEKQRAALWPAEALEGDADSLWISEQSAELLSIARRIASTPLPVLLTGETGTGKEMLARAIHRASGRADRPMHPFNCTAVPRDMLESQLFGYRRGAFTGADASFPGVIRAAAGGTLFLDEIGDIGLDLQPKLLRFLEHQEVHPLGEPQAVKVDVRVIAATNANLEQLVAQGRFREDLLYRLNVLKLHLPPLRERREEIPPLVQHYIRKYADEQRKGHLTLADETLEYLLLYAWPGNLRQLANEVRRMVALAEVDSALTPALLSPEILASRRTIAASAPSAEPEIRLRLDQQLPQAVELLEQTLVRRALERSNGRVEEAARLLGISRKGLFLKRRRWGLRLES